jgi:hypothetical protein
MNYDIERNLGYFLMGSSLAGGICNYIYEGNIAFYGLAMIVCSTGVSFVLDSRERKIEDLIENWHLEQTKIISHKN